MKAPIQTAFRTDLERLCKVHQSLEHMGKGTLREYPVMLLIIFKQQPLQQETLIGILGQSSDDAQTTACRRATGSP